MNRRAYGLRLLLRARQWPPTRSRDTRPVPTRFRRRRAWRGRTESNPQRSLGSAPSRRRRRNWRHQDEGSRNERRGTGGNQGNSGRGLCIVSSSLAALSGPATRRLPDIFSKKSFPRRGNRFWFSQCQTEPAHEMRAEDSPMAPKAPDEQAIFEVARKIESREAREAYLQQICGDDTVIRQRVRAPLRTFEESANFQNTPPSAIGTTPGLTLEQSVSEAPGAMIGPYKLRHRRHDVARPGQVPQAEDRRALSGSLEFADPLRGIENDA